MRLPYAPTTPPPSSTEETQETYSRIRARRHPRPLQALDLTLLHSAPVADGWNSFLGAIRTKTTLPADIREILICRVAALNSAVYEWEHHAPLARESGGVTDDGIRALEYDGKYDYKEKREMDDALSEKQWACVWYADAMTRDVKVREEVWDEVKRYFGDQECVEITATVACYNCVSRFLVALDVGEKNPK